LLFLAGSHWCLGWVRSRDAISLLCKDEQGVLEGKREKKLP
jgi:hypothetical protein